MSDPVSPVPATVLPVDVNNLPAPAPNAELWLVVHFVVSKLFLVAVPILNQILAAVHINVTTSNSSVDECAFWICTGIGLAYSWWTKKQSAKIHTAKGFNSGLIAGVVAMKGAPGTPSPVHPLTK